MEKIGLQILNLIDKLNLSQSTPSAGSTYILPDGSFVNPKDNNFSTHSAFDEYIVSNSIADFENKLLPITYCNAIRCNDGTNFTGQVVMELPLNPISTSQVSSIEKYIDYLTSKDKFLLTLEVDSKLYDINLKYNDSYDVAQSINQFYKVGDSVFKQFLESKNALLQETAIELHDTLNPKLWTVDNKLKPLVHDKLIRIVDKYIENSDVLTKEDIIDVELLGSNASYNYTPYSDLDIHLVVNMESLSCDPELFQLACNAERSSFNKNYNIMIKGIEVEMYVEDVKASTASNGIYSLYKDEWIKFPKPINVPNYDNDEEYIQLLSKWKNEGNELLVSAKSATEIQTYINNLYNLRRISIMTNGEYAKGNLVFKEIRNEGLLDNLKKKQYKLSSKELSLESVNESMKNQILKRLVNSGYTLKEIQEFFKNETGLDMIPKNSDKFKVWANEFLTSIKESKKRFRVNYLLNESFHYSMVESDNEIEAETTVKDFFNNSEDLKILGTEEEKTHLIEPGNDSGMAEIINKLIIDEWEAISGYNSASITAQEAGLLDAARLFSDLSKEEIEHVGELQQLLKSFDKNTHSIVNGEEEAKEKLEEPLE